jgi:hypothetical protein
MIPDYSLKDGWAQPTRRIAALLDQSNGRDHASNAKLADLDGSLNRSQPGATGANNFDKPGGKVSGEGRADTAAGAAMGRDFSQISHGLTGRHWIMASMPDTEQDADVRIRIPAHWPDTFH